MRAPYTQLFAHLVWAPWDRVPSLAGEVRAVAYECIRAESRRLHAPVIALGGVEDHVHVLVRLPTTIAVAGLVKRLKGTSSHMVDHEVAKHSDFRWQGGYGAFTVSRPGVSRVRDYIHRQEEHHGSGSIISAYEPAGTGR